MARGPVYSGLVNLWPVTKSVQTRTIVFSMVFVRRAKKPRTPMGPVSPWLIWQGTSYLTVNGVPRATLPLFVE